MGIHNFFLMVLAFELRAYTLSHYQFFLGRIFFLFFEIGSRKLFLGLASNFDPPDLCLLSNWDYRLEPPVLNSHT
jgi:hypothetical protein